MKKIEFVAKREMMVYELLKENNISTKLIKSMKAKGNILKDGKIIFLKEQIQEGDIITCFIEEEYSDIEPIEMPIEIAYEDEDLIVVNKQYGLPVMSTMNMHEITLLNGLSFYFQHKGIESKIHVVNRLDRNTTGLMIVSKNRYSAEALNRGLKDTLKRRYYAIVEGILSEKEGKIIVNIEKESEMTIRRVVRDSGKEAITTYKVIKEFSNYSLLDIELLTGRTHQIRVTFSYLGHPLVGEDFYKEDLDGYDLMLHSYYLEFVHPGTNDKEVLITELPIRFVNFIKEKGGDSTIWLKKNIMY